MRDRTRRFLLRIIRLYSALPKSTEEQVIGKQLLRSDTSVGAHYREASRSRSTAEFVSKLEETAHWVELLQGAEIVIASRLKQLSNEIEQLTAILVSSVKTAKTRNRQKG